MNRVLSNEKKSPKNRILLLSCCERKNTSPRLLPALERYDGPAFFVLRKFLSEQPAQATGLDVYILSAKFGLIAATQPIPYYDLLLDAKRCIELQATIRKQMQRWSQRPSYRELFISLTKRYEAILGDLPQLGSTKLQVRFAQGKSGGKLSDLRDWLYESTPPSPDITVSGKAVIRGQSLCLTAEQVIEKGLLAFSAQAGKPSDFQSWYVQLGQVRVSPKWLVSQLTGLSVNDFHSDEARRVLSQLGIETHRT
ncbi:MAG: hypothetical protein JST85_26675 [Acidobacteria bacterium]|nr:hypothetical protein [Acidobacteriota bacterium]